MSGTEFIVSKIATLNDNLTKLDKIKREAEKIPKLEKECSYIEREIIKKMEEMDLISSGNFGWENRRIFFMIELYRNLTNKVPL